MKRNPANEVLLSLTAQHLGELCQEFVFLGGCAAGLLITDAGAPEIRSTQDVDCIVDVVSLQGYYALAKRLREKGFRESQELTCRWEREGIILDVMPTDARILGFTNMWYPEAIMTATDYSLPQGQTIRLVAPPYFLATKYEAFLHRGQTDYYASHDLEDIISVIDGRAELIRECQQASPSLRSYLAHAMHQLLAQRAFIAALPGHLGGGQAAIKRLPLVLQRLNQLAALGEDS